MGKISKGNRYIKYWEIEDSNFCMFELYENDECVWWGLTGKNCLEKLLEKKA